MGGGKGGREGEGWEGGREGGGRKGGESEWGGGEGGQLSNFNEAGVENRRGN